MEYKHSMVVVVVTQTESMEDNSLSPAEYTMDKTIWEKVMSGYSKSKTRLMWWMRNIQRCMERDNSMKRFFNQHRENHYYTQPQIQSAANGRIFAAWQYSAVKYTVS